MLKNFATTVAFATILATPMLAQADADSQFLAADQNRDGFVSESEFYMTQDFDRHGSFYRADRDNDLRLTATEFKTVDFLSERRRTRESR